MEQHAERLNRMILKHIAYPLVGRTTTSSTTLQDAAHRMFGARFAGVFARDRIPNLTARAPLAIANLDNHDQSGSHWIALAFEPRTRATHVYDSFGRTNEAMNLNEDLTGGDADAEQLISDTDCGARSLAYLLVFDNFGSEISRLI